MRVLVSNDDGVDAPGIHALAKGLRDAGHEVVVVAPDAPRPRASALRAFLATGGQGINYRPGVWHMPLTPLAPGRFLVVDRVGDQDCAIWPLDGTPIRVVGAA